MGRRLLVASRSRHKVGELHDLLAQDGPDLVLRVLDRHADGTLEPITQDEQRVTLAPKMKKADGRIDPRDPADLCRCRVNGYSPWPGVTAGFRSQPLKLLKAEATERPGVDTPGTIIDPENGLVACAPGTALRLLEVQPPGKKPMAWADFARGRSVKAGETLEDPPPV